MASNGIVRVSRWEEIPELLRERLLDQVTREIVSAAAQLRDGMSPVDMDPYVIYIFDCAKALGEKMLRGDS